MANEQDICNVCDGLSNKNPYTIISLISEQIMPNILFINYMKQNNITLDKYIFVYTNKTKGVKNNIKKFLEKNGTKPENIKEIESSHIDFIDIQNKITEELNTLTNGKDIIFNITGGTKMMSCALFYVAQQKGLLNNTFYVDENKIYKIEDNNCKTKKEIYKNLLNIEDYFGLSIKEGSGFKFHMSKPTEKQFTELNNFVKQIINNDKFLKDIKVLHRKEKEIKSYKEENEKLINKYNLIIPEYKKTETDKNLFKFITTGWLEEVTYYNIIHNIALETDGLQTIDEKMQIIANEQVKTNTTLIIDPKLKVQEKLKESNEIDVCFMHENNLYLVECKTSLSSGLFNDTTYKIKSIQRKLGLFSKAIVVTLNKNYPTNKTEKLLIQAREDDENIKTLQLNGTDINLYKTIINRINPKKK